MIIGQPPTGLPSILKLWLDTVYKILFANTQSGTTANRPTKFLWVGRRYFDTSLAAGKGKPIWVSSYSAGAAVWVDATGTTV